MLVTRSEILRKLIHLCNLSIPIGYLFVISQKVHMSLILGYLSILFIIIDFFRLKVSWLDVTFKKMFNSMLRPHELKGKFTGATWVIIGAFITTVIFPKDIAILALLFMGLGDTVAGLIGAHFGRIRIWDKTMEGTLAGLLICLLVICFFPSMSLWGRLSGAFSAILAELIPTSIDDNILMPLASGFVMVVVRILII